MKNLSTFKTFAINEEWSKNDPIQELNTEEKLGIILIGTPGVGKTTFIKEFILPRKSNIRTFSTDDVSLLFTKDPNKYYGKASDLNILRLKKYIETSGHSFVYDTTGSQDKPVFDVFNLARRNGYCVIFVHLIAPLDISLLQNLQRDRNVDEDYIRFVYDRQWHSMKDYARLLRPDNYYIVTNFTGKYKFHRYEDGKMMKRKVDQYVPMVKESVDIKNEVDKIVDNTIDLVDSGDRVSFHSPSGNMSYQDYLAKNSNFERFKPVHYAANKKVSKFSIVIVPKENNYNRFSEIIVDMNSTVGRLFEDGWLLRNVKLKTDSTYGKVVKFLNIEFVFEKEYEILSEEFPLPDEKKLRDAFEEITGLSVREIEIGDYDTDIYFDSNEYDGRMPSESWMDEKLEEICDLFGFSSFTSDVGRAHASFEY